MDRKWLAKPSIIEADKVIKYCITSHDGAALSFGDALTLWQENDDFCQFFNKLLAESSFTAYRWETPSVTKRTLTRPFEFVLVHWPMFASRSTDASTFRDYFGNDNTNSGVVTFRSLGKDSTLVVPTPIVSSKYYGHLAAFVRFAPESQTRALWRTAGTTLLKLLSDKPLWLNTAGGGVAWLHVRLDSRPKYYMHAAYKE